MRLNSSKTVRPRTISQDIRNRKDTLKKKNMTKKGGGITTHNIVILNPSHNKPSDEVATDWKFND